MTQEEVQEALEDKVSSGEIAKVLFDGEPTKTEELCRVKKIGSSYFFESMGECSRYEGNLGESDLQLIDLVKVIRVD